MKLTETPIHGVWVVEMERLEDDRGFFARAFCQRELAAVGVDFEVRQANNSVSSETGTVRGFHFQYPPSGEDKLIRCIHGGLFDVVIDLRPESPTFLRTHSVELTSDNRLAVLVPKRCGNAFQTLTPDAEALYLVSEFYAPGREGGIRHDDPALGIRWPLPVSRISEKDAGWPLLEAQQDDIVSGMGKVDA